jgi:hypothetical protein
MTIPETTIGTKKIARSAVFSPILALRPSAMSSASAFTRRTVTTEKPSVNPYADRIRGSENNTAKFASPMKDHSPKPT